MSGPAQRAGGRWGGGIGTGASGSEWMTQDDSRVL